MSRALAKARVGEKRNDKCAKAIGWGFRLSIARRLFDKMHPRAAYGLVRRPRP